MNEIQHNIAIVILAAGSSSRMGSPKQLLSWGNSNLLNVAIEKAIKTVASKVVVVLGANYKLIEKEIKHQPITVLNNKNWNLGLGKSISCAAEYILKSDKKKDGVLIVLADQPKITTSFLNEIIDDYQLNQNQIIATSYDDDKFGVPALFDSFYFKELSKLTDDNGAKNILKKYKSSVKILNPPSKNIDIDSKEDYKKFHK